MTTQTSPADELRAAVSGGSTATARRTPYDRALERIAAKHTKLAAAADRATPAHATDYETARDATWDVLVFVIRGRLTDGGMAEPEAALAARQQATELVQSATSPIADGEA